MKMVIMAGAKSVRPSQPAQKAQADLGGHSLLALKFLKKEIYI